ncbi:hypothetical protein IFM89_010140 [Coptis chinensis]|uniref:RRM domain-containing protein n=1 Tax=Coptis chinensis TaxID=261450 RepID=A0A835IBW3_9MAGN|nr:hypothetical protein IFM89_010140 [Coptis chinensis]
MARVYVGSLDARVTEKELEDEFRSYGPLRSIWVAQKPPGYAFIDFDDRRDALDAIREVDGATVLVGVEVPLLAHLHTADRHDIHARCHHILTDIITETDAEAEAYLRHGSKGCTGTTRGLDGLRW